MFGLIRSLKFVKKRILLRGFTAIYTDAIRGTPLLLQIIIIYYGLPLIIGIHPSNFSAGLLALCLYTGGYVGEVFRAGIESIEEEQWKAARSLGLKYRQIMRYVILPQGIKIITPAFIGISLGIIKDSSMVSIIGFIELARAAHIIGVRTLNPFPPYIIAGVIYFIICYPVSRFSRRFERAGSVERKQFI